PPCALSLQGSGDHLYPHSFPTRRSSDLALNAEGGPRVDFSPDDPACAAIMGGISLDVVEMDAASNNSVDDIRELRENVALAPMRSEEHTSELQSPYELVCPLLLEKKYQK